ncbi:hypothetical protein Tco_0573848 [Tanacetum coccineum]
MEALGTGIYPIKCLSLKLKSLGRNRGQYICCQNHKLIADIEGRLHGPSDETAQPRCHRVSLERYLSHGPRRLNMQSTVLLTRVVVLKIGAKVRLSLSSLFSFRSLKSKPQFRSKEPRGSSVNPR